MRSRRGFGFLAIAALVIGGGAGAAETGQHRSVYAGEESRTIKALSAQDIDDLLNGRGWGFAKAAELNGLPGPAHLLELADEIGLNEGQRRAVQSLYERMRSQAMELGRAYVEAESQLDQALAASTITPEVLAQHVTSIASLRGRLRLVHLQAHLEALPLVTAHQKALYSRLRGYGGPSGGGAHAH